MNSATSTVIENANRLVRQGRFADAADGLERHLTQNSGDVLARRLLVQTLTQTGDLNAAIDAQKPLVPADMSASDDAGRADALLAAQLAQMAMYYDDAADLARAIVVAEPDNIAAAQLLATLLLWQEGPDAAHNVMAAALKRDDVPAHMLAEALAYTNEPSPGLVKRVRKAAEDTSQSVQTRSDLLLALAQQHDLAGDHEAAWQLAVRGNALAPARPAQDWHAVLKAHLRIHRETAPVQVNAQPPAQPPAQTALSHRHLYLLGTPRSGQSLLQSILAAAPGVVSLGERGALLQHILFRTGPIAQMARGSREDLYRQLATSDARGIARLVGDTPMLLVDKSPLHLAVAGSVERIHPDARFAAVLRDPADMAMSIWLRSFPPVYDYATDFGAILDHLDFAMDAVSQWREAGVAIRLIDHAELVGNPSRVARALFDWLGLGWDEAYLKPENRTQPVPTFSAAQVRQPISAGIVRGAKPYVQWLEPYQERIAALELKRRKLLETNS